MKATQEALPWWGWIAEEAPSTGHMPLLRTDETIFSWLSRYAEPFHPRGRGDPLRAARTASKAVLQALFGAGNPSLLEDFPRCVGALADQVPGSYWSCDTLIEQHTALPYYSRFLGAAQYAALRASMVGGVRYTERKGVMQQAGGPARASTLAYCEECVAADLMDGKGPPSWRRLHQLPGVFVCAEHSTVLWLSNVPACRNRQLVCCPGTYAGRHRPPFGVALAVQLAEETRWLLENPGPQLGAHPFKKAMHDLLQDHGLKKGSVVSPALRSTVETTFGASGLEAIGLPCRLPEGKWCRNLLSRSDSEKPGPPLQWLVLLATLKVRVRDFLPLVDVAATHSAEGPSSRQIATARRPGRKNVGRRSKRSDEELIAALQAASQELHKTTGWPPRATAARLLRLAGIKHPRAALARICPLAAGTLAALVEDERAITARRLLFLARKALQEGACPTLTVFGKNIFNGMHPRRDEFRAMTRDVHRALVVAIATVPASAAQSVFENLAAAALCGHEGPTIPAAKSGQERVQDTPRCDG